MKNILKMDNVKAKSFFLKPESYTTIDLPVYFNFSKILDGIRKKLKLKIIKPF